MELWYTKFQMTKVSYSYLEEDNVVMTTFLSMAFSYGEKDNKIFVKYLSYCLKELNKKIST